MRVCQIGTSSLPEGQQWLKSFKVENDTYYLSLVSDTVTTDKAQNLDEVVIVSEAGRGQKRSVKGQVASIDEHLKELKNVSLVRRGSYAWEPVVNNMAMEGWCRCRLREQWTSAGVWWRGIVLL